MRQGGPSFHWIYNTVCAKPLQSCLTLRPYGLYPDRLLCLWDSPSKNTEVGCHFLLQFVKMKSESEVAQWYRPLATPWTAAYQGPPSMGFSRQEYWSGVPLPSPCSDPVPTDCIQRTVKLIFLHRLAFMLQILKWLDLLKYGIWLLSLVSKGFF